MASVLCFHSKGCKFLLEMLAILHLYQQNTDIQSRTFVHCLRTVGIFKGNTIGKALDTESEIARVLPFLSKFAVAAL